MRRFVVALLLLSSASASSSSWAKTVAKTVAVLAVPGDPASQAAASKAKSSLAKTSTLVDDASLATRLRGPAGAAVDVAVAKAGIAAADDAFARLDHERSVSLLENAIAGLEADRDFSVEKRTLLEDARLKCAQRLLGLAGPGETGNGESKNGAAARRHLENALKSNPGLQLGKQFPPKMKTLFAGAQDDVDRRGLGGFVVRSTPPGAAVVVDGRALGPTPFTQPQAIAPGTWRLWIEEGGRRSAARVVDVVKGESITIDIDLDFEGSVDAAAVAVAPRVPFTTANLQRLGRLADADVVIFAGASSDGEFAVGVERDSGAVVSAAALGLGEFAAAVPPSVFTSTPAVAALASEPPPSDPPSSSSDEGGEFPWAVVGVGGAVAGVVVIGAVVAGVVYATRTVTTTATLNVSELP